MLTKYISNHSIISSDSRIHKQANTDKTSRDGIEKIIFFSIETHNSAFDGGTSNIVLSTFVKMSWSDLDFHTDHQDSFDNTSPTTPSFKIFDFRSWLIDVKTSDDDHLGGTFKFLGIGIL